MTISVRLSTDVEKKLREQAELDNKNISNIVNSVLENYYQRYRYFESIDAHMLDPILISEFFALVTNSEKIDTVANGGYKMIRKFISFHNEGDESLEKELQLINSFLKFNAVRITFDKKDDEIRYSGVHEFPIVFSKILVKIIEQFMIKRNLEVKNSVDDGTFTVFIKK